MPLVYEETPSGIYAEWVEPRYPPKRVVPEPSGIREFAEAWIRGAARVRVEEEAP